MKPPSYQLAMHKQFIQPFIIVLASARMPVVDQNHQMILQASLQHCCQVNVSLVESESLDIERVHFRRAILDLEQVAPLVDGGGALPNVYNRRRVRLES